MTEQAFTQHVAELVRNLFWRHKPAAAAVAVIQSGGAPSAAKEPTLPSHPVVASRLQLIGLERVRTSLGDRWQRLAERVRDTARVIIDKHMLPGDVCEQHGEDGFLVLFPQLSPDDAKFKSQAICREIERTLIGQDLQNVSECTAEIKLMTAAQAFLAPHGSSPDVIEESEPGGGKEDARKTKRAFAERLRRRTDLAPPEHASGRDESASEGSDRTKDSDEAAAEGANGGMASGVRYGVSEEERAVWRNPSELEWRYRPVWDFKHTTLIMFALHHRWPDEKEGGAEPAGDSLLDVDTAAVAKCVADLSALSASGRRLPVLSRLHYGTIDNPRRRAFFSGTIRTIPAEFRKLIAFEIVGCPHGGLNFGICAFIGSLRQNGVKVALSADNKWPDYLAVERAGAQIVSMNAFDIGGTESERMIAFEIFAARAANAKLEGALWGLATRSLVVAAASSGIRYLAGGAVAPEIPNLSHALRFSPIDLYPHS